MTKKVCVYVFFGCVMVLGNISGQSYIQGESPTGATDGVNAAFTLKSTPTNGTVAVYKNGVRLQAGSDYALSGSSIVFLNASIPQSSDVLTVDYMAGQAFSLPIVNVVAPSPGQQVSGKNVAISAMATDNVGITSLQMQIDGDNMGAPCSSNACSTNWDTTAAVNGSHMVGAVARDAVGNAAGANLVNVVVSNTNNGYSYWRALTLAHGQVPNTDQSNFPVLISGTYPSLATVGNGGHVQNANGYDIIFTSDAAGQNLLNWEIESYSPATGALNAWVQVPTLSHSADTVVYMFYGNSGITSFQGGAPGSAWDSNFAGVWHLSNGSTLSAQDSTANANNGAISGATAAIGEIGGAASFNGASTSIDAGHGSSLNANGKVTLEAWINPAASPQNGAIVSKWNIGFSNNNAYTLYTGQDSTTNKFAFAVWQANGTMKAVYPQSATFSLYNWAHVAGVADGSNLRIYVNGVDTGSTRPYDGTVATSTKDLVIGKLRSDDNIYSFNGVIDEVRVSTTARSADWIATEYNNQSSPATFCVFGGEQANAVAHLSKQRRH